MSPRYPRHKTFPVLTSVFDRVHRRFFDQGESLESMSEAERTVFVLMCFDGPLLNGGFQFWVTEQHTFSNDELIAVLDTLDARRCDYVKRLVREASRIGKLAAKLEAEYRPDEDFDALAHRCQKMDIAYWLIRDEFLADVETQVERLLAKDGKQGKANPGRR